MNSYKKGWMAEWLAVAFLTLKGYRVICRRYKTPVGEADIIARRGRTLVFIEVKARSGLDKGLNALTPKMKSRITRTASHFVMCHPAYTDYDMRFDLMVVCPPFSVHHLDNAWYTNA